MPKGPQLMQRWVTKTHLFLLWLLGLTLVIWGSWRYASEQHRELLEQQTYRVQKELYLWLQHFQGFPQILSQYTPILSIFDDQSELNVEQVNFFLLQLSDVLGVDFAYVFDQNGKVLATSNYFSDDSFLGDNYGFRPYVKAALAGGNGNYLALGMKTQRRGYYFSAPVRIKGHIVGGIALKVNIDFLTTLEHKAETDLLVLDENNVVFFSGSGKLDYLSMVVSSAERSARLQAEKRYGERALTSVNQQPELAVGLNDRLQLSLKDGRGWYAGYKLPMPGQDWSVMSLSGYGYRWNSMGKYGLLYSLLYALVAAALLIYRSRVKYLNTIRQLNESLEDRVKALTQDLTLTNQDLSRSLEHYKKAKQELEETQSELLQTAKLAVLGEMAAGINHELNQPLQALLSYSENGQKFLQRGNQAQAQQNLAEIASIANTMAQTVAKFKIFSRKAKPDKRINAVKEILDNTQVIVQPQLHRYQVNLHIQLAREDILAWCEPVMVGQVLVNLVSNAIQALEGRDNAEIWIRVFEQHNHTQIQVEDNGPGIELDVMAHIFEPFFTTKEKGLGLGLTISKRIIDAQGGSLTVERGAKDGTLFTLSLLNQANGDNREL